MVLTINPPDIIFVLNMFAFGGLECTFFWPLVGGLFWKKGTKQAAVCSSVGAIATYIFATYPAFEVLDKLPDGLHQIVGSSDFPVQVSDINVSVPGTSGSKS